MKRTLLALMFVVPALAGCIADDTDGLGTNGSNVGSNDGFVSPFQLEGENGHDHSDASQHDIVNHMTLEAFLPLGKNGAPGGISEMHVAGDYVFQGVMGYGFQIIDVADPQNPKLVTSYDMSADSTDDEWRDTRNDVNEELPPCVDVLGEGACAGLPALPIPFYLADLKTDETGDWLFVALELSTNPGVFIYDVQDKSNPKVAGFWPNPGLPPGGLLGCHMIEYAMIDGDEYLFCAPLDDAIYVGQITPANEVPVDGRPVREIVTVARWLPSGASETPRQLQTVPADPTGLGEYSLLGGHQDMTWQVDPLNPDAHVLSASMWDLGWYWIDVTNPVNPTTLGSWHGGDSPDYDGKMHTAMMFESDGQRIALGIPEVADPPVLHVLDVTDYAAPEVLAHWNARESWINEAEGNEAGRFSTHNFQVVEGKVYMTHYHAGTVVLDLSTPELLRDPQLIGSFVPMDRRPDTYGRGYGGSWDVVVWKGYAYTANQAGFFVIHQNGEPITDEYSGFA